MKTQLLNLLNKGDALIKQLDSLEVSRSDVKQKIAKLIISAEDYGFKCIKFHSQLKERNKSLPGYSTVMTWVQNQRLEEKITKEIIPNITKKQGNKVSKKETEKQVKKIMNRLKNRGKITGKTPTKEISRLFEKEKTKSREETKLDSLIIQAGHIQFFCNQTALDKMPKTKLSKLHQILSIAVEKLEEQFLFNFKPVIFTEAIHVTQ